MLNILSARKSVKSFDEPIAEDVTISCNIRCIHPFLGRYKTWGSLQQLPNFIKIEQCVFRVFLIKHRDKMHSVTGTSELELFQGHTQRATILEELFTLCPGRDPDAAVSVFFIARCEVRPPVAIYCFCRTRFQNSNDYTVDVAAFAASS